MDTWDYTFTIRLWGFSIAKTKLGCKPTFYSITDIHGEQVIVISFPVTHDKFYKIKVMLFYLFTQWQELES